MISLPTPMRAFRAFSLGTLLAFTALGASPGCGSDSSDSGGGDGDGGGKGGKSSGGSSGSSSGSGGEADGGTGGTRGGTGGKGGSSGKGGTGGTASGAGGDAGSGGEGAQAGGGGEPGCSTTDDSCPAGQYCGPDGDCLPGCKDDASCASGNCTQTHDCDRCVKDEECAEGRVCGDGHCHEACSSADDCSPTSLDCCDGYCANVDYDIHHCTACGLECDADQFCGTDGCSDTTLANVCKVRSVVVVIDEQPGDLEPARALGAALAATCMPAPTVTEVEQADATVINPATGQPLGGGDVLALAGGLFGQRAVRFFDESSASPLQPMTVGNRIELRRTDTGEALVSFPPSSPTASHDYLVIEVARDPTTGVLAIIAYGFHEAGTAAAVWYFSNEILPDLASHTEQWLAFEWTDDGDLEPGSGDTFTLLDSGP
jgi:hypothetical protein